MAFCMNMALLMSVASTIFAASQFDAQHHTWCQSDGLHGQHTFALYSAGNLWYVESFANF
jgi:hypothetical protein